MDTSPAPALRSLNSEHTASSVCGSPGLTQVYAAQDTLQLVEELHAQCLPGSRVYAPLSVQLSPAQACQDFTSNMLGATVLEYVAQGEKVHHRAPAEAASYIACVLADKAAAKDIPALLTPIDAPCQLHDQDGLAVQPARNDRLSIWRTRGAV